MMIYDKIIIAKIAWSSDYQGGSVFGHHKYLVEQAKEKRTVLKNKNGYYAGALGHEAYNFLPYKGMVYAYIPPMGEKFVPPKPEVKEDWLVIFVSRIDGNGDLVAVGWYEHAAFCWNEENDEEDSQYLLRKEYSSEKDFPLDGENNHYHYCVETQECNAHFIPVEFRKNYKIDKKHQKVINRSIAYARGNKSVISEDNKRYLVDFAKNVLTFKDIFKEGDDDSLSSKAKRFIPPKTEMKKNIENEAISFAVKYFEERGYDVFDVQKKNLGWDLTVKKQKRNLIEELHVEVKGTSRDEFHLFLSKHEFETMFSDDNWRIFVVKNVLSDGIDYDYLDREAFVDLYRFDSFCYECQRIDK